MLAKVSISVGVTLVLAFRTYASERSVKVAMMTLSRGEGAVLGRRDRARRSLEKAPRELKLSWLLINLEKRGTITRTRYGGQT